MLLALVGVTGAGKTYYKDKIVNDLNFKKVNTIRTRKIRMGEVVGKSGIFMTREESEDIFSDDNMVFEMHYTTIYDWKKIRPDIKTIYIFPKDVEIAKQKTRERNLASEKEKERISEIDEHYNRILQDEDLRKQFDYIVYNNYDEESDLEIINLVKRLMN